LDKKEVWTNPAPLVDKQTGRIFIFYALSEGLVNGENLQRYTKVFYKFSDDEGLNWSNRVEVTGILNSREDGFPNKDRDGNWITDFNKFPCDFLGRAFHMPGPGHGIQLSNGRLLLQVWNRTALGTLKKGEISLDERRYGISTIYSDDHGETWKYGSSFAHNGLNGSESRIAELQNGDIYLNTRYVKEKNSHRMIAYSYDKGITWGDFQIDQNFPLSNTCDAGLIAFKDEKQNKTLLLYSKNESPEGRKNLVIRLSSDRGKSWPISKIIDEGPAQYSDLAVLPDNSILLIYETGKKSPVYCIRFNLEWLKNNR
jgi:Neuraminidase (sialidase)